MAKQPVNRESVSDAVYRRHVLRYCDTGDFFIFRRKYVRSGLMSKLEALFLQDLMNLASMNTKEDEEWFRCTVEEMERLMLWDANSQKYHLRMLKQKGLLDYKKWGSPPKRHVFIDIKAIETALDELNRVKKGPKQGPEINPNERPEINPNIRRERNLRERNPLPAKKPGEGECEETPFFDEETIEHSTPGPQGFFTEKTKVTGFDRDCSTQLYEALANLGKVKGKPAQNKTPWAKHFSKLRDDLEDDTTRIQRVLNWYVKHVGEAYVPEAYCGQSFREKFIKLESTMERKKKQTQHTKEEERQRRDELHRHNRLAEDEIW